MDCCGYFWTHILEFGQYADVTIDVTIDVIIKGKIKVLKV